MDLLITIDAEGDNAWARQGHENHTRNARFVPRFHQLCRRYGFKPTYLTTWEMAGDDFFVEFARAALAAGECEVGAHPHAWNQPPAHPADDMRLTRYLIEYPEPVIEQKVGALTDRLTGRFGVPMRTHRAGRWAFNATYAAVLAGFGYTSDCSVAPHDRNAVMDRPPPHGVEVPLPSYGDFPDTPYFLHPDDIARAGASAILEIPMTIVPRYPEPLLSLYWSVPSAGVQRAVRGGLGQPVAWFRPNGRNLRDLLRIARRKLARGDPYLMFMLHSSELMPGGNPTFRTPRDIETLYQHIEQLFHWLHERGARGATLTEYRDRFARDRRPAA